MEDIHTLINSLLVIISIALTVGMLFLMYSLWNTMKPQKQLNKLYDMYSVKEDSVYNMVVQKIICKLKSELNATKIVVGRFHNGGNYVNGLPMKKFTLTHETAGGTLVPMMDKCVAVLNSRYSEAFAQLCALKEYYISDVEDCTDLNFKRDMKDYGFSATYLFLILQFDGSEDGFIGVNFKYTTVLTKEQRHKVIEEIPRIIGLLNMQKEHLR